MKLAYTVGTPDTRGNMLAYRGDLPEICTILRDIGYDGTELFVRDPRELDVRQITGAMEKTGLEVPVVGTGPVVAEDKLTFVHADENVRKAAVERAKLVVDFAALFGAQVNVGKLRGDILPTLRDQSWAWMKQSVSAVCEYGYKRNVNITIEPQNRFVINNLNTTQQALAWIRELQQPNLFVMLDVFHMHIEDRSMAASIVEAKEYNVHVHFAENNRGIPGAGQINFPDIVRVLKATGYDRYITLEIDQLPDSYQAARAAFNYLQALMKED